jgi:SAM-dependent methyltransferase
MKTCDACEAHFESAVWACPCCGATPPTIDGHLALSPTGTAPPDGFDAALFPKLAALEARNFWFRHRNRLIVWALGTYFPGARTMLEIGCGTGYVLAGIKTAFPTLRLTGSEPFAAGLREAAKRLPATDLLLLDARRIPYDAEFDVVGAFDVLEHIDEDERVLEQLFKALVPGGGLLLTVPNHPWMWSAADVFSHHRRRYTLAELTEKVARSGFELVRVTAFTSLLFPLMVLSRALQRRRHDYTLESELRIGGLTNRAFGLVCTIEARLIAAGGSFPFGGSILLAARRPR